MAEHVDSMARTAAFAACLAVAAQAQFKYPDCPDVTDADFKLETLVSNATNPETSEPLKMDFAMDAAGNVDVYFTQRFGLLRKWSGATKTVVNLHKFTLLTGSSDGLQGIALDPAFKTNGWVYLFYSGSATEWRVSRFTLAADRLDPASEKILLKIAEDGPSQHPGGALAFDWDGNLWITVGDNNKPIYAANSNDLRGKILRIKPTAEGGYTIPKGNLYPEGTAKTRAEIYVMGSRNAYSLSLDPGRKAVTWGDVGPDAGKITEEHNFTTKPGNFGWPFFAGDNIRFGGGGTVEQPLNTDGTNTGLQELPPAIPSLHSFKQSCAITGPVYYYDGRNPSKVKFPPHFNGAWFAGDFNSDTVSAIALNPAGTAITADVRVFKTMKFNDPIEFRMGPDGALYVMNYAGYRTTSAQTGLYRIVYTGACLPANPVFDPSVIAYQPILSPGSAGAAWRGSRVAITAEGDHELVLRDMGGRVVLRRIGAGPGEYSLDGAAGPGVHLLTVRTARGTWQAKVVR